MIPLFEICRDRYGLRCDLYHLVTLGELTIEGAIGHDFYARLFGKAREIFGIECLPGFAAEAGKSYLLQTASANYEFKKGIGFGDLVIVSVRVSQVGRSSFKLKCEYINDASGEVCAVAEQCLVYTNTKGVPEKIPNYLLKEIEDSLLPNK